MNVDKIEIAILESERFIKRAKLLLEAKKVKRSYINNGKEIFYDAPAGKESGATKRASLDLTRALSDMRNR